MKISNKIVAFVFLAVLAANAQEFEYLEHPKLPKHPNTRVSVYLHPVAFVIGLDESAIYVHSTIEIPISLYNAFVIKPSFWKDAKDSWKYIEGLDWSELDNTSLLRIGSGLGFRHYPGGRGEGLYLQGQAGAYYLSIEELDNKNKTTNTVWYDFTTSLGQTYKFAHISLYSDVGVGYACTTKGERTCSLVLDGNLGIGLPF